MIKGDYDELVELAKNHICGEHGMPLVVAWSRQHNIWVLRCDEGHYPDMITRQLSFTELYRTGQLEDGPIKNNIERREKRKMSEVNKQTTAITFAGVPATDLATGEVLSREVVKALVAYARKYHLDPYRGHVVVMYSMPYITLDGYLYHANQTNIAYKLSSRPLQEDERKTYLVPEGAYAWLAEVIMGEGDRSFTGLGIITQDEMTAKSTRDPTKLRSPVAAAHPWQLAQKRAERQALRRGFPIGESEEKPNEAGD